MRTFLRVAEVGSFSAVAQQLGVARSVVTRQVAALEAHLGAKLLARSTRRLSLTSAGTAYLEKCRVILNLVEAAETDVAAERAVARGKLRIGLPAMAKIFSTTSDQHSTVQETETDFIYTIHRCPVCWGRSGLDKPVCFIAVGLLQEALKWVSGGSEFRVNESKCIAMGDDVCEFRIQKTPIS